MTSQHKFGFGGRIWIILTFIFSLAITIMVNLPLSNPKMKLKPLPAQAIYSSLPTVIPPPNVIFVIRSYPKNFGSKLSEQANTWLKELKPEEFIVSASNDKNSDNESQLPPSIPKESVVRMDCPSGHALGPACTEASALIHLWNNSISNNFNWAFIIDDDVLVFPEGIKAFLNENANYNEAYGTPGCGSHNIGGFCGGGGYAISKQAIGLIIEKSGSSKNFLNSYMDKAKELEYSDIL